MITLPGMWLGAMPGASRANLPRVGRSKMPKWTLVDGQWRLVYENLPVSTYASKSGAHGPQWPFIGTAAGTGAAARTTLSGTAAGSQTINGDAAQQMMQQVSKTGVCNRQAFPTSFGLAGSEAPRVGVMETPAADLYRYMAAVSGPNGPEIVDRGGNPAPMRRAPRPGRLTPGEDGKSAALIPTWGAPSIAGAPGASGVGLTTFAPGRDIGTMNVIGPPQFQPQYQPHAGDPTEVGGPRIGPAAHPPPCHCPPGEAGCDPCKDRDANKFGRGKMAAMLLIGVAAYAFLPKKR